MSVVRGAPGHWAAVMTDHFTARNWTLIDREQSSSSGLGWPWTAVLTESGNLFPQPQGSMTFCLGFQNSEQLSLHCAGLCRASRSLLHLGWEQESVLVITVISCIFLIDKKWTSAGMKHNLLFFGEVKKTMKQEDLYSSFCKRLCYMVRACPQLQWRTFRTRKPTIRRPWQTCTLPLMQRSHCRLAATISSWSQFNFTGLRMKNKSSWVSGYFLFPHFSRSSNWTTEPSLLRFNQSKTIWKDFGWAQALVA